MEKQWKIPWKMMVYGKSMKNPMKNMDDVEVSNVSIVRVARKKMIFPLMESSSKMDDSGYNLHIVGVC
jgi:hypothetical protein